MVFNQIDQLVTHGFNTKIGFKKYASSPEISTKICRILLVLFRRPILVPPYDILLRQPQMDEEEIILLLSDFCNYLATQTKSLFQCGPLSFMQILLMSFEITH